jgi:hypothetical protein
MTTRHCESYTKENGDELYTEENGDTNYIER